MKFLRLLIVLISLFTFFSCSKNTADSNGNNNNSVPVISSASPNAVTTGGPSFTLVVNGSGFVNGSVVKWNTTILTTTFISATKLAALVPAVNISSAGTIAISVFTPAPGGGASSTVPLTISNGVLNNPLPVLNNISPDNTTVGSTSFTLTANGTGFVNGSVINWNGISLTTTYTSGTELTAIVPAASVSTAGSVPVTITSPAPGGGTSNAVTFNINAVSSGKKFLFDATHAETAGNADWVIDEDGFSPQTIPTPAQSTVNSLTTESYWTGALSSWGILLAQQGNTVETLPQGASITYGNTANPQDLSHYDVYVVDEPNTVFSTEEKTAILNFVSHGGGLFMVSDHTGSDRDFDGWDSPAIWNDLMSNNTVQANPFGFSIDLVNFSQTTSNVLTNSSSSPVLTGSQGTVIQLQYSNGTTATITPSANPNVKGLIWKTTATQNNSNIMSLSSVYGTGRIFFVGDSSPLDDGTGGSGNTLYSSWTSFSHQQLFMNASLWLAKLQ